MVGDSKAGSRLIDRVGLVCKYLQVLLSYHTDFPVISHDLQKDLWGKKSFKISFPRGLFKQFTFFMSY